MGRDECSVIQGGGNGDRVRAGKSDYWDVEGYKHHGTAREVSPGASDDFETSIDELLAGLGGDESGEWVTDNYNWISLTWEDGSHTGFSLNLGNLEYSIHSTPHTYELEHLDEVWSYASDYLTED